MPHVVFVHGLANKPEAEYLHRLWSRKLAHDGGISLGDEGVSSEMAYWADVLYPSPDTNLASYESSAGEVETLDMEVDAALDLAALSAGDAERIRRLSRRLGVDPDALDDEPPPADEIEAVRQERVPVPRWLRKRIMARFVRDAHHYFFNIEFSPRPGERYQVRDELRRRFLHELNAAGGQGPLIVVSHSMGTVIAYDCLMHDPACPVIHGLVTVGSPLGLDEVQDFFPAWTREEGFPTAKLAGRWLNVFDPLDVVAGFDPLVANDYQRRGEPIVEDLREDSWGYWRHSISKYLQGPKLRGHLAKMLGMTWP